MINEALDRIDEARSKITFRKLSGIIGTLVIFIVIIFCSFVAPDFSLDRLKEFDFWFNIIKRFGIAIVVPSTTFNLLFDRYYYSPHAQDAKRKYLAAIKLKDISFKDFLVDYNHKLKAQAWRDKIDKKIVKITARMAHGYNLEKYAKKVDELEKLKTDEYIDANWRYLSVKWNQVVEADFTAEESLDPYNRRARSQYETDVRIYSSKKAWKAVLLSIFLGMIGVHYVFAAITGLSFWWNLLVDIILVVMRMTTAGLQAPVLVNTNYTNVWTYKTEIMAEYIQWQEDNGIEKSKAFKIMEYIEKLEANKTERASINTDNKLPSKSG